MHKTKIYFIFTLFAFCMNSAFSCSRPPGELSLEEAYQNASNVYLAFASNIKTTEKEWSNKSKSYYQDVDFLVLDVWKGNRKVKDVVKYSSHVLIGSCAVSPTNDPPWLESDDLNDIKSDKIVYVKLSGVWVIFEREGQAPILTFGSGTKPLEYGGAESLKRFYELSKNEKH